MARSRHGGDGAGRSGGARRRLLTASEGLSEATRDEIVRFGISRAVLLGGTEALSDQVRRDLEAAGVQDVDRLSGADRFGRQRG